MDKVRCLSIVSARDPIELLRGRCFLTQRLRKHRTLGHLYIETSAGFISERFIVRMSGKHASGEWTVFFFDGDKCCEATASPEAAKEFWEKNDPIGR